MTACNDDSDGRSLRWFHIQASLAGAYQVIAMPTSVVLTGLGIDLLGMSKENAGLIGALAFLAGFLQVFSFVLTNRVTSKKRLVIVCGMLEALFLAAVLLPARFPAGGSLVARQAVFLALIFATAFCASLSRPTIENWLARLVQPAARGRYLSVRWVIVCLARLGMVKAAMAVLDRHRDFTGFAVVIIAGCLCAAGAYLILLRVRPPGVAEEGNFNLQDMRVSLHHRPFRTYIIYLVMLYIGFAAACSYYGSFFLVEVGLSYAQMSQYLLAYNILLILGMLPAGRLVDRFGARPLIYLMIFIYTVFFLMFPFFTRERLWLIVATWGFVGLADGLFFVASTSALYHSLPAGRARIAGLALSQGIVFCMMGTGPLIVRVYLQLADRLEFVFLGQRIEKFRIMYAVIGILVFAALAAARRLEDTHEPRMPRTSRAETR